MRMWMVDPVTMCDQHLLGEHVELHMLAGTLARGRSIAGFIAKGLLEPSSMQSRHEAIAAEMGDRGFRHKSPLPECEVDALPQAARDARVDVRIAAAELGRRCERCRARACEAADMAAEA